GVRLVPRPGRTRGHGSVRSASGGEEALISGDFLHHPCQMALLDLRSTADHEAARAAQTRRDVFGMLAGTEALLFGTHFATPSAGRVVRDGDGFALVV